MSENLKFSDVFKILRKYFDEELDNPRENVDQDINDKEENCFDGDNSEREITIDDDNIIHEEMNCFDDGNSEREIINPRENADNDNIVPEEIGEIDFLKEADHGISELDEEKDSCTISKTS